jgi:hypothetical protein
LSALEGAVWPDESGAMLLPLDVLPTLNDVDLKDLGDSLGNRRRNLAAIEP